MPIDFGKKRDPLPNIEYVFLEEQFHISRIPSTIILGLIPYGTFSGEKTIYETLENCSVVAHQIFT